MNYHKTKTDLRAVTRTASYVTLVLRTLATLGYVVRTYGEVQDEATDGSYVT